MRNDLSDYKSNGKNKNRLPQSIKLKYIQSTQFCHEKWGMSRNDKERKENEEFHEKRNFLYNILGGVLVRSVGLENHRESSKWGGAFN